MEAKDSKTSKMNILKVYTGLVGTVLCRKCVWACVRNRVQYGGRWLDIWIDSQAIISMLLGLALLVLLISHLENWC